ncbi:MAG: glycosyltransferase [Pseudomonadota bacterium]|nr:glycosyltransferase [Pseudomonadota bacterium]
MAGEPARNPRVLHVYRTYFPDTQGGGEELIRQICRNTRGMGIDSRVFTLSPDPAPAPIQRDEALVIQARRHLEIASCGISLSALPAFRAEAARADVLHYHFPWPFGDALHLLGGSATRNKPTVVSHLSDVVRQRGLMALYQPLMRRFLARADRIVATSPNYAASSPLLGAYRDKLCIIPIGLDDGQLPAVTPAQVAAVRERHGEDFLLFVGVFRYYKGLHVLLEAARDTRANIVIAGAGPEEAALRAFAREHKLANVRFAGRVSDADKAALLHGCRGLVFPSHLPAESFGISLLEAAMVGRPMISCEIGTGTTYVNRHGETGLVVAPGNAAQLATAMNTLAGDEALAARLGAAARRRYEALFTGAAMGERYAALYRELLGR